MFHLASVDAEPFEELLAPLIVEEDVSVEETDEGVERAVEEDLAPDTLVDAAAPLEQDPVEAEAGGVEVVEVGHRHHPPPASLLLTLEEKSL